MTKVPQRARKRTPSQIVAHRVRIAELILQRHSYSEIADILYAETYVRVTPRQIGYDVQAIREGWRDQQHATYNEYVMQELARIDALEREAWEAYRRTLSGDRDGEPRLLDTVHKIQQERRRILGVYTPTKIGLDVTSKKLDVQIKGYIGVSPDDWDEQRIPAQISEQIIEGEVVE